jgi:hypothetical protein
MRVHALVPVAAAMTVALCPTPSAAIKAVAYPEVKVNVADAFKPDAAFEKMHRAFVEATAKKDMAGLLALVGPTFVWTLNGGSMDHFDMGRDASHNFKVVFGFRGFGKDADGGVEDGPFWDVLAAFAADTTYYQVPDAGNLVCGPLAAEIADENVLERAGQKIETGDEGADWYFTIAETPVAKTPGDTGTPIAKIGTIALPVIGVHPPTPEGQPAPVATHLQVLLPSGKTGWIPASAARPLASDRLCYARTADGEWKIAAFDQTE